MALKTPQQYLDELRQMDIELYMFGEKVENRVDHPVIRPSINSVAMTYKLALDPEYEDIMTATSNLTGKKINRFTHLHQSTDDLIKKVKMQRLLGQKTGSCFQRCVGLDAFNALYSTTFEIDQAHGTEYHQRFRKYMEYVQENDLVVDGCMTDARGDRSKAPGQQPDPDACVQLLSGIRTNVQRSLRVLHVVVRICHRTVTPRIRHTGDSSGVAYSCLVIAVVRPPEGHPLSEQEALLVVVFG